MAKKKRPPSDKTFLEEQLGVIFHARNPIEGRISRDPERDAKAEAKAVERSKLRDRVKAMRPYFGELFTASKGYNLRYIEKWPKRKRTKVHEYWRIMAPLVSRPHKARYYRDPAHLHAAIVYTQQEELLKGQTAALFDLNQDEVLKVRFTRGGQIKVERGGVSIKKVYFDPAAMIEDPIQTVYDAADQLRGATRFKLIMGPHESRGYWKNIDSLIESIAEIQAKYSEDDYDEDDKYSHFYANWLFGLIGYYGKARTLDRMLEQATDVRIAQVKERGIARQNERIERRIRIYKEQYGERCKLTKGCVRVDGHKGKCRVKRKR